MTEYKPYMGVRVITKRGKDMFKYLDGRWADVVSETPYSITVNAYKLKIAPKSYKDIGIATIETDEPVTHTIPKEFVDDKRKH